MAQVYSIDGVPILNRVRTTADPSGVEGLPSSAWYGEAMIAGVTIEDPLGELDLMGWHTFTHDETSCVGAERTFTGWITGKDISRGTGRERTGAARIWNCEIIDQNAVWKLKIFRAASAKRPAESDNARMDFMLASAPMAATPVADNGRWNTTDNPTNFGPSDYVTQFPIDLANSVAGTSGKNFYAYWDDATGEISGHYDLVTANPLSTIAISNDIADSDSTTVYPLLDAVLTRSPEDQVNGVLFGYQGGNYVYAQNPTLFGPGEFSPVNFDRDVLYTTDRVGLLSTANALAAEQLAARSIEHDTLVVTVLLPPAQVNLLHAGMRVSSKFTHLPGYEDFVDLAVVRRDVLPPTVREGDYTVRLELTNMAAPTGPGSGSAPPPGGGPFQSSCDVPGATVVQDYNDFATQSGFGPYAYTLTLDDPPTPGNLLIASYFFKGANTTTFLDDAFITGWTLQLAGSIFGVGGEAGTVAVYTRVAQSGDSDTWTLEDVNSTLVTLVQVQEWQGVDTIVSVQSEYDEITLNSVANIIMDTTSVDGEDVMLWSAMVCCCSDSPAVPEPACENTNVTIDLYHDSLPAASGPFGVTVHEIVPEIDSGLVYRLCAEMGTGTKWFAVGMILTCSASSGPPPAGGQWIMDEFVADGDGATTDFVTAFPYIAGSLKVFVDGVPIINGLTQDDPDTGAFSLDFAPQGPIGDTRAERITVNYQAGTGS